MPTSSAYPCLPRGGTSAGVQLPTTKRTQLTTARPVLAGPTTRFGLGDLVKGDDPEAAGARAFRQFCIPRLSSHRAADHERLAERARIHLGSARRHRVATSVGDVESCARPDRRASGERRAGSWVDRRVCLHECVRGLLSTARLAVCLDRSSGSWAERRSKDDAHGLRSRSARGR